MPGTGVPPNAQFFELRHFGSLDTKSSRDAIKETDFAWIENLIPIGGGNLRSMYGPAPALFTAGGGKTVKEFWPFNIAANFFQAVFLSDGSAVAIANPGGGSTTIGAAGTFTSTGGQAVAQWGSKFLLIIDPTKGYFIWDGTTLFIPGGSAPAAFGGTMPSSSFVGTDIEVYQNRVWVINGPILNFSAPGNGANFSSLGGGSATSTDSQLRVSYFAIHQASGFLYLIGDSSVWVINNVVTSGSVTTYNYTNVDPQSGTIWRDSTVIFGRAIMFANPQGIYALYGGAAQKVSAPLDGLLANVTAALSPAPTASLATMFGIKVYCIMFNVLDPFGVTRPLLICWDGKNWFIGSQNNNNITAIAANTQNSVVSTWATDGTTIFQCFATPSSSILKRFQSKLVDGGNIVFTKELLRFLLDARNNNTDGLMLTISFDTDTSSTSRTYANVAFLTFINNAGGVLQFQNNSLGNLNFTVAGASAITWSDIEWSGKLIGFSFSSTNLDFTLVEFSLMYIVTASY